MNLASKLDGDSLVLGFLAAISILGLLAIIMFPPRTSFAYRSAMRPTRKWGGAFHSEWGPFTHKQIADIRDYMYKKARKEKTWLLL